MPSSAIKRYGPQLLEAITTGLAIPGKDLPLVRRTARPESDHAYDQRLERLKALRNRRAKEVQMEPGLFCPNGTLQAVARAAPEASDQLQSVTEMRKWQRFVLGEESIIASVRGPEEKHSDRT